MIYSNYTIEEPVGKFMYKVYGWMSAALALTAGVAYYVGTTELFGMIMAKPFLLWGIILAELGLVIFLSAAINKIDYSTAALTFILYSVLNGVTLSSIFHLYLHSSVYSVFLVAAGMFAGIALYGYTTKADLTGVGSFAIMMLWGLILAQFVNFFFRSAQASYIFSFIGVIVFCLLTAYDVQKIKQFYIHLSHSGQDMRKFALIGALTLYLDFINLFLFLLRLIGRRRD